MRWFVLTIILILIDQLTKQAASYLGLSVFLNDKFAFSLPIPTLIMFAIYVLVLVGISIYIYKTWSRFDNLQKSAWCFVYAGGLSNIIERIILSHVRDFIPIAGGILNVADLFILFGLLVLLISQRQSSRRSSNQTSDETLSKV